MSQNKNPINLPAKTWVNLYADHFAGTPTQFVAQVIFSREPVKFADTANEPTESDPFNLCLRHDYIQNDEGDAGAWAYSESGAIIIAREV